MNIPGMGEIVVRLAETHRVYALELPGHGRYSMGAATGLRLAIDHPE